MGEYFRLVNESNRQYIDPIKFPDRQIIDGDDIPEVPLGIKHMSWMAMTHSCIPVYLLTDSNFDMWEHCDYGEWCGAWAGDAIRLIGDTRNEYDFVQENYEDVSIPVFKDIAELYEWFPTDDHK